jgi:hypothetical protein
MHPQDRQQRQPAHAAADANGGAADSSADVESRIAAAVSEAVAAAQAEAGEEMEDLLACLGEWSDGRQHVALHEFTCCNSGCKIALLHNMYRFYTQQLTKECNSSVNCTVYHLRTAAARCPAEGCAPIHNVLYNASLAGIDTTWQVRRCHWDPDL